MHAVDRPATGPDVLALDSIVLHGTATTRQGAITEAGQLLVTAGAVDPSYVDAMHEREKSVSTYMGNGLAIPHGTNDAKDAIRRTGISFVRYPEPIDWNGKPAEFVVGIAGAGKDHLALLTQIAQVFLNAGEVDRLRRARTPDEVRAVLAGVTGQPGTFARRLVMTSSGTESGKEQNVTSASTTDFTR